MAGTAETKRIPRPPAAVDFELDFWFRNYELEVLTGSRRLDGTILLGSKRATQKFTEYGAFGDGLGHWFENGITEYSLRHPEVDEHQMSRSPKGILTPNNC
jgi:hypothetical protein